MNSLRPHAGPLAGSLGACLLLALGCSDATGPTPDGRTAAARGIGSTADPAPVLLVSRMAGNMCADISGGSPTAPPNGTQILLWGCHNGVNQQFTLQASGQVTAYGGAVCLDVAGGAGRDGDAIIAFACHGGANQRWTLTAEGELRTAINGKCVDVGGARNQNGTALIVYTCHGGANQQWTAQGTGGETPPPVQPAPPAPVPPDPAPPGVIPDPNTPGTWALCASRGSTCRGVALRDVRLGGPNGPYVVRTQFGPIVCETSLFGGTDPAPGQALHCDALPMRTATISNPMPGMNGLGSTTTVALGDPGLSGPKRLPSYVPPGGSPDGSFRTTCNMATWGYFDPIVYPGRANAAHLHVFFGNTAVNPNSTPESLVASGNSTCRGGTLNRSSYWAPALVDAQTGDVITPEAATFYYKTGYNMPPSAIQPIPAGLRMVAGDMRASATQEHAGWHCRDRQVAQSGSVPTNCGVGDAVRMWVEFPQCWDGVNLDSPDHKSHMAYPVYSNNARSSRCPSSHPVALPAITEHFDFPITDAGIAPRLRLSSDMYASSTRGGYSAHADWMNGWDPSVMRTMVTQCLNAGRDCQVGLLGDGTELQR